MLIAVIGNYYEKQKDIKLGNGNLILATVGLKEVFIANKR
jgi:hypothetical protein